jgi:hypothetical protein
MFDRLSRSWELLKASWSVLQQDKELLVFPLISSIAMLVVVACFALPLLGTGWTVATYLVVPVLVTREVGPIEAVKESATLLKRTWGENVIGQAGIGVAFGLIQFALIRTGIAIIVAAAMTNSVPLIIAAVVILVSAVLLTFLVHGALSGIYAAALYRYATNQRGTAGFSAEALQLAFRPAK